MLLIYTFVKPMSLRHYLGLIYGICKYGQKMLPRPDECVL